MFHQTLSTHLNNIIGTNERMISNFHLIGHEIGCIVAYQPLCQRYQSQRRQREREFAS